MHNIYVDKGDPREPTRYLSKSTTSGKLTPGSPSYRLRAEKHFRLCFFVEERSGAGRVLFPKSTQLLMFRQRDISLEVSEH